MKCVKKLLAVMLVMIIALSPCMVVSASASVSMGVAASFAVESGVDYAKYTVYGSQSGHTEAATVLEFDPADGYIPVAFAAYSGTASVLSTHYSVATNKYGYDVAGIINGSYFSTSSGTLTGILVSGGKFACADIGYTYGNQLSVVAFDSDGNMNVVDSLLKYDLYVNGTLVPDALRFINKRQSSDSWRTDAVYYYDSSCGKKADSSYTGYEVICQKNRGSELKIGQTMTATVVEVKSGTCGTTFGTDSNTVSDRFVLSTKTGSSYAGYLSGLKAGDTVEIAIEETIAASKTVMENAESVITNVGMLVKDGVDQTDLYTTIGDHNVKTTYARWTAFGQKADGSYVYFTSEGGSTGDASRSLTLKDVAAAMIKLGCVNVVRLDGGGSSAMYVSNTGSGSAGYVQYASRAVADCLMIVKKPVEIPTLDSGDPFWLTHYNDITAEGAGAVMTESYTGGSWNMHVAFTPVEGTDAYEITDISDGTSSGSGTALSIPDGGFVYTLNYGNDYVSLGLGSVDYTSDACSDMIARAKTWVVGDRFVFGGLDLSAAVVPTSTPSVKWYDDSYVCTALMDSYGGTIPSDGMYISAFNTKVTTDAAVIFTPAFNGGTITPSLANHKWTYNLLLTWNSAVGAYLVTDAFAGSGSSTPTVYLSSDQIMIAVHGDSTTPPTVGTRNKTVAKTVTVGQAMLCSDVNVSGTTLGSNPYVQFADCEIPASTEMPSFDGDTFWVTHFNNVTAEGAGAIMTETYTGGGWNLHVAFSPVSDYTYEITAISDGTSNGSGTPLAIPDGGFVYSINRGNDYVSLGWGSIDYTSDACDMMLAAAKTWAVGDKFVLGGLDIEGQVVPTSTSSVKWYDDSYVCTAVYARASESLWVTHYNDVTVEGAGAIMTKAYTGGAWNLHIAFAPVYGTEAYEIVAISDGISGGKGTALSIPTGGFVYLLNYGNDYISLGWGSVDYTSDACDAMIEEAKTWAIGDRFVFDGIDLDGFTVPTSTSGTKWYEDSYVCTATYLADGKNTDPFTTSDSLWVTHYNDVTVEGAGSIMTKAYTGGAWNLHIAFAPVEGSAAYEITAISDGTSGGKGTALTVPDGGFVYMLNYGNDYISLGWGSVDYTSDVCDAMIAKALTWSVGDQFVFSGIDTENLTVPTTTSGVNWYDDGYVCTATYAY